MEYLETRAILLNQLRSLREKKEETCQRKTPFLYLTYSIQIKQTERDLKLLQLMAQKALERQEERNVKNLSEQNSVVQCND